MPNDKSLLSFVARRHAQGRFEDAATDALFFILSRSSSARHALSDFISKNHTTLSIKKVLPQSMDAFGAIPDLACLDGDENVVALIE